MSSSQMNLTKTKKCLNCGKEFEEKRVNRFRVKKFCSQTCQTRYNARKYYKVHKDDPAFKKRQREYWKIWIEKNREHFNDLVRVANREYQRKRRLMLKFKKMEQNEAKLISKKENKISS